MIKDFKKLLIDGYIGFYTKCEVVEIFGFNKETEKPFNIFTLVVFEETKKENTKELLTNELQSFIGNKKNQWGIQKRIVTIATAENLFKRIIEENIFQIDDKLEIEKMTFLQKQFIQTNNSTITPQINFILKNNFHIGSYIIEGFDEGKEKVQFLLDNPVCLNNFSEEVSKILPIRIGNISDRLGNIIFQFPVNLFKLKSIPIKPNKGFTLDIVPHCKLKEDLQLEIIAQNGLDNSILDFNSKKINNKTDIIISTSNILTYQIINKANNLIMFIENFTTINDIGINMIISSPQDRIFYINDRKINIPLVSNDNHKIRNQKRNRKYEYWILNRKYKNELKYLENSKSFIQYFGEEKEKKKALNDIRYLINTYGNNGVYLWDPYLNAIDIKNTLFYCKYSNVELKAITSLEQRKITRNTTGENLTKKDALYEMKEEFNKDNKKYLFLNLEVRGKIGNHGYNFHDRFLIFPQEQAKVWSLGISVNQLGKSHHILQQVKNAQHILNAFNQLWESLNVQECLVWKSM